jgi:hypothetical protein
MRSLPCVWVWLSPFSTSEASGRFYEIQ